MPDPGQHYVETPVKLIVRVLQDIVAVCPFETYADLADELKWRCAKLKIPYDGGLISEAIARLEEGGRTPLIPVITGPTKLEPTRIERPSEPPIFSRQQAADWMRDIRTAVHDMPASTLVPDGEKLSDEALVQRVRDRDRLKALRMVQQEILETVTRVEALEATSPEPDHDERG